MSGTDIRVIDLPDLGTVTDASSIVADSTGGTGRFTGASGSVTGPFTQTPISMSATTATFATTFSLSGTISY